MTTNNDNSNNSFTRTNQQIRVPQVRLIDSDGSNRGIVNTFEALKLAKDQSLDLVEINPRSSPPVAKILDYGKHCYEQKKAEKEAKKAQKATETREIAFRPNTDENDLGHKIAKIREFLTDGARVKVVVKFRGRELQHADLGKEQLEKVLGEVADLTASYTPYALEGRQITTVVSPK